MGGEARGTIGRWFWIRDFGGHVLYETTLVFVDGFRFISLKTV